MFGNLKGKLNWHGLANTNVRMMTVFRVTVRRTNFQTIGVFYNCSKPPGGLCSMKTYSELD